MRPVVWAEGGEMDGQVGGETATSLDATLLKESLGWAPSWTCDWNALAAVSLL